MSFLSSSAAAEPPRLYTSVVALLLALGFLAACDSGGDSNGEIEPPTVANAIQDQGATAGGEAFEIDLRSVFSAPPESSVSFSASSSDPDVAAVSVEGAQLTVTPGTGGEATATVAAQNEAGRAEDEFGITVFADPPDRPDE